MTFFYSNNQLPRRANAKRNRVILFYHLKIRQKNKKITIYLQSCMTFSLSEFSTTGLFDNVDCKGLHYKNLWHYNDGVPGSMAFSLGVDICMCLVLSGSLTDGN